MPLNQSDFLGKIDKIYTFLGLKIHPTHFFFQPTPLPDFYFPKYSLMIPESKANQEKSLHKYMKMGVFRQKYVALKSTSSF